MREKGSDSSKIYLEPGEGSTNCRIQIVDDDITETDVETFTVKLSSLSLGTLGTVTTIVTIDDDDGKCHTATASITRRLQGIYDIGQHKSEKAAWSHVCAILIKTKF